MKKTIILLFVMNTLDVITTYLAGLYGGDWGFDISASPYRIYRILGYKK